MMDQVTPNLESVPERTYIRIGKTIQCFKVPTPDRLIWQLDLPSVELAIALMEDLYYGEYTGG